MVTMVTLLQSNGKLKLVRSLAVCEEPSPPLLRELPQEQVNAANKRPCMWLSTVFKSVLFFTLIYNVNDLDKLLLVLYS